MSDELTIGNLRRLIADLPDDAEIIPMWANGSPGRGKTAIDFDRVGVIDDQGFPVLAVYVRLERLT